MIWLDSRIVMSCTIDEGIINYRYISFNVIRLTIYWRKTINGIIRISLRVWVVMTAQSVVLILKLLGGWGSIKTGGGGFGITLPSQGKTLCVR